MPFDRFMIAPVNTGLETDLKPWIIPDDAFAQLNNTYVFRGRVRKRFGSMYMGTGWDSAVTQPLFSRFRINLGNTSGGGGKSGTVPGTIFKIGQLFSIADEIFTVYQLGTPAAMLDSTGTAITATYNTTTGAYVFAGVAVTTPVYFYPAEPVMGLTVYQIGPINNSPSYGFDTQFAYVFSGSWARSGSGTTPIWHGDNLNFFWTCNWEGAEANDVALFVTNFQAAVGTPAGTDDPIWYFDGSNWVALSAPSGPITIFDTAGDFILTSRLIVQFHNRLLLLNTIEQDADGDVNSAYVNRCRYSHYGSPISVNAWLEPNQVTSGQFGDGAGFVDATTEEAIITAGFIKDRLIVYFERSTWELVYTGNELQPFVWQKINTELGAESQQSVVSFDKALLAIGNTGVHSCTGANVERIDNKIPDLIFQIVDKNIGVQRVAGIRDFYVETVYWSFPSTEAGDNESYPTKVLVYNYRNGSWGVNDDSITAFGYFEQQIDTTWASSSPLTWEEANMTWSSGVINAQFRQIIAGNQEGYVFIISADISRNASVLQITNMVNSGTGINITIVDHNLSVGDYIIIENAQGITGDINEFIFPVFSVINVNTIRINPASFTGTYRGGGVVGRVSMIDILTKQYNPYISQGRDVYIAKIDFGVEATEAGEITIDYFPSSTELSMLNEGGGNGTDMIMGTGVLETSPYPDVPLEQQQTRLWHPVYLQTQGECIQMRLYLSDSQIRSSLIAFADFQLDGMLLYCQPTGRLE